MPDVEDGIAPPSSLLRRVASLWTSEVLSSLGLQAMLFVLPLAAVLAFDATPLQIGILNSLESVAALAFGLGVGILIDRLGALAAVVAANLLRAVAAIVAAVALLALHELWLLFIAALLLGVAELLNESGVSSAVLGLVGRDSRDLNRVNSVLRGTLVLSEVSGPGVAGIVVAVAGLGLTAGFTAGAFLGAAVVLGVVIVRLRRSSPREPAEAEIAREVDLPEAAHPTGVLAGVRFIRQHAYLRPLVVSSLHFNFFSALVQAVFVVYCVRSLGFSTSDFALVGIGGGIGGVLGSALAATAFVDRHGKGLYSLSLMIPAACVVVMVAATHVPAGATQVGLVAAAQGIWSGAMVICIVLFNTARQLQSPTRLVGQIAASERLIAIGGELPGALLGGLLGLAFPLAVPMMIGAVGMLLAAGWIQRLPKWQVMNA